MKPTPENKTMVNDNRTFFGPIGRMVISPIKRLVIIPMQRVIREFSMNKYFALFTISFISVGVCVVVWYFFFK